MISSILSKPSSQSSDSVQLKVQAVRLCTGACKALIGLMALTFASLVTAQQERWFTYELSVFSNETPADRLQEPPRPLSEAALLAEDSFSLTTLAQLLAIDPELFTEPLESDKTRESALAAGNIAASRAELPTLPSPIDAAESFRFADLQRDKNIALPPSASDFQQTNRALERSPDYRLLFHAVWRAPLADEGKSAALAVESGALRGSIDLHFNARRDRIVLDTQLGLEADTDGYYLHSQSREMRSGEFHYLDSPALGVIFLAQPYELPPPTETLESLDN